MKLWFERWNVNAYDVLPLQRMSHRPLSSPPPPQSAVKIDLAATKRRADSAANNFYLKM
jgi:hypothetical protein